RKADVPGRDLEGATEHELPDEEKAHEAAHRLRAIALAQIPERAARSRHRRPELAPDHAVAHDDHQGDEPAQHRLWTAQRGHEERDRDERPDPDHVRHVERRGVNQAEPAYQGRRHGAALARAGVLQRSIGFAIPVGRKGSRTFRPNPADAYAAYRTSCTTRPVSPSEIGVSLPRTHRAKCRISWGNP